MEVHFTRELEARLDELAAHTGRAKDELVQDVVESYLDELAEVRVMLDHRYNDIKNGEVEPVDGDEAFARLRQRSEARRNSRA